MKTVRYYTVSNTQLFIMAILMSVFAAALITLNSSIKEYLQLPMVTIVDDKCVAIANYKNGEAFTCNDVGTILRNYRVKKN